jgi:hypothetical protein
MALAGDHAIDRLHLRNLVGAARRQQQDGGKRGEGADHGDLQREEWPQA